MYTGDPQRILGVSKEYTQSRQIQIIEMEVLANTVGVTFENFQRTNASVNCAILPPAHTIHTQCIPIHILNISFKVS